jgi:hypothetical protein
MMCLKIAVGKYQNQKPEGTNRYIQQSIDLLVSNTKDVKAKQLE